MGHTIEFKYAIGDKVVLMEINRPAQVMTLSKDLDGISYRVVYWDNGSRKTEFVFDWELKSI